MTRMPLPNVYCPQLGIRPPAWAAVTPARVSQNYEVALHHFQNVPWTAALLEPTRSGGDGDGKGGDDGAGADEVLEAVTFSSRGMIPLKTTQDQFLHSTLYQTRGLRHMLCFVRTPDMAHLLDPEHTVDRIWVLWTLGAGVTSHNNVIHGGMTMTIVDESMGALHDLNSVLEKSHPAYAMKQNLTGSISVQFMKPIRIGDVLAESWIDSIEDRKIHMVCELKDQKGTVMARCKATWITPRARL